MFSRGSKARPEDGALLSSLLQHCGLVEEGPEAWIDVHTGLSGSGVAFVSGEGGRGWGERKEARRVPRSHVIDIVFVGVVFFGRCTCLQRRWLRVR